MQHQKLKLLVIALLVCAPIYAAVVINTSFPVNIPVLIPCAAGGAGEVVTLTGNLHVLMSVTVNANNVSFDSHFQAQGISGTGSVTGDKYQATGITRSLQCGCNWLPVQHHARKQVPHHRTG